MKSCITGDVWVYRVYDSGCSSFGVATIIRESVMIVVTMKSF